MHPQIRLGALTLSSYEVLLGLAVIAGGTLSFLRLTRGGVDAVRAGLGLLAVIWGGILGVTLGTGALGYLGGLVGGNAAGWQGGSAYPGGLAVAVILALVIYWRSPVGLGRSLDLLIVGAPLAQAIARVGCLLRGCCYGQLTQGWLGMVLPDSQGAWLRRYPTRLLAVAANLAIMGILLWVERRARSSRAAAGQLFRAGGTLFLLYMLLYGLKRVAIGFLRADASATLGPLNAVQLMALGMALAASVGLAVLWWWGNARAERAEEGRGL